ncbi:acyl-carrier-like protein [Candidatus Thiomargarita nelsonii]|uniref:Acyl-carrier-like protein n=1 Tax=Candidatus Thiomargarita nelsonii TaxID=1003181 RepID=A0A176S884_9GAMM|nr:acyl-carrier-like protein [Candidatus Thiomargarita nelsonii]
MHDARKHAAKEKEEKRRMIENMINQLKHIIADEIDANIKLEEIDETASLFEDGIGLDSMAIMEFINLLEDRFGFEFSDSELNSELFRNIKTLADFISTKVDNKVEPTGTIGLK